MEGGREICSVFVERASSVLGCMGGGGGMGGGVSCAMHEGVGRLCVRNRDVAYWVAMTEEGGTYTHADSM